MGTVLVRWGRVALKGVLAAFALWLAGLALFAAALPSSITDPRTTTDAIVVLTGGSGRVPAGIDLLAAGMARTLFLSGVGPDVTLDDLHATIATVPSRLRPRVILGHAATDTIGNARETAQWMAACGYHSLRLVTAAYHMPRSLVEFRAAMPDVVIVPHPVFPGAVKLQEWWKWRGTALLIAEEYSKFLVAWLRGRLHTLPVFIVLPGEGAAHDRPALACL
ncbi:YdcF family protein [Pararhodospirillum oryzae]|uniref:DUF218 domain-containing protein n=1 Tax=Pararhodospirillum oryzae TaxID=478448 RepID=A0A512H999_9PROT|nr:YdcF family protein [Pararhodospirillum oryzae]GEO81988.1 hypothetical protein ROR02_21190 [Pararhodospirillum oryzae]